MHFIDMIFWWARAYPTRPAIITNDGVITYLAFANSIVCVSERLARIDLDRREPVAVLLDDPAKLLTVSIALLRSGFTVAPVSRAALPHLHPAGIRNIIGTVDGLVLSGGKNIRFDETW